MNQKSISRKISYVIIILVIIEVVAFAGWYVTQPSYKNTVISIVQQHESPDQSYYFLSLTNKTPSLDSIFNALSIYSELKQTNLVNSNNITNYVMSMYNASTGLFNQNNKSSLTATFDAVSSLAILGKTNLLNKTGVILGVISLQTSDFLFRGFSEENNTTPTGEIDHLYQALSIFHLINPDQNLSTLVNTTQIIESMASLQDVNGGISEGVINYSNETGSNLVNAYYFTESLVLLNTSSNISNLTSKYLRLNDLKNWIATMYSSSGFTMQGSSSPSVEATAYALISYRNLGVSNSDIQGEFPDATSSITNFLNSNFVSDFSRNTLDVLNDVLNSLNRINQISILDKPYFNSDSQFFFSTIIAATIFAFILNTLVSLFFMLREDDSKYFEGKLHTVIEKILNENRNDLTDLSMLLGEEIESIELESIDNDEKLALIKAYAKNFMFVITYETFNGLAKKVEKFSLPMNELLSVIDFLESDIFFTIDEGIQHLKTNQITT